jgi:hypothetical protein
MTFQLAVNNNLKMSFSELKEYAGKYRLNCSLNCQSHIISMDRAESSSRTAAGGFFGIPRAELKNKTIVIPTESSIYSKLDCQLLRENTHKLLH